MSMAGMSPSVGDRNMKLDRRLVLAGILALAPLLASAGADAEQKTLRVGIMSAEDEDVWAVLADRPLFEKASHGRRSAGGGGDRRAERSEQRGSRAKGARVPGPHQAQVRG